MKGAALLLLATHQRKFKRRLYAQKTCARLKLHRLGGLTRSPRIIVVEPSLAGRQYLQQ